MGIVQINKRTKCPHPLLTRHIQHVIYPSSDPVVPVFISTTTWTEKTRLTKAQTLTSHNSMKHTYCKTENETQHKLPSPVT